MLWLHLLKPSHRPLTVAGSTHRKLPWYWHLVGEIYVQVIGYMYYQRMRMIRSARKSVY